MHPIVPRTRFLQSIAALLVAGGAAAQAPAPGDLVLNEVQYDPPPAQSAANEWVEVLNVSDGELDLAGLVLADESGAEATVPDGTTLAPGGFLVFARDAGAFADAHPGVPFVLLSGFPALNNGGDRPALRLDGLEIDAVPYAPSWGGEDASLERVDPFAPSDDPASFATSTDPSGGTPGAQNSVFAPDTTPPEVLGAEALDAVSIRVSFSEPLDPASAESTANYTVESVGPPAVALLDPGGRDVLLGLAAPLAQPRAYTLTVRGVADRRGNVLAEASVPFFVGEGADAAPGDLVVNEILYDPPAADDPGEFVELVNRSDVPFDLRSLTLNDAIGEDTPITDRAVFLMPGEYAVVVEDAVRFAAVFVDVEILEMTPWSALNNGGDAVVLRQDGALIDSVGYAPSWGGEDASLERKDPAGPSSAAANWATTADFRGGTPGDENSQFAPDVTGPQLVGAEAALDGRSVTVQIDEPADPASMTVAAFEIVGGPGVTDVRYGPGEVEAILSLGDALPSGSSAVVAVGLRDPLGNVTDRTETTAVFTPDETPPVLISAEALFETAIRLVVSEPVTEASATDAGGYEVVGLGGAVAAVDVDEREGGGVVAVVLRLGAPLADRTLTTVAATGLVDLAGVPGGRSEVHVFVGEADVPGPGDVVVNEIQFDPVQGSVGEYVELLNTTASAVFDLRALALDGEPLADAPAVLVAGEPLAIVRDAEAFAAAFPDVRYAEASRAVSLPNDGDVLVLHTEAVTLDSVAYDPGWHRIELEDATGVSLERRSASAPSTDPASWSSSLSEAGGTPSAPNSVGLAEGAESRGASLAVTSPFAPTRGEAAEITYTLSTEAALVRCRIYDGGGRPVRELEPGRLSGSTATLVWDGTGDDRRPLRAGIYVVLLEAFDAEGATAEAARGVVVLARPR